MKITLEETEGISYLRCEKDGKALLWVQNDKITIQNCDHYRWFLLDHFAFLPYIDKGVVVDDDPKSLDDFEDAVREQHISAIAIGNRRLYLVPYPS